MIGLLSNWMLLLVAIFIVVAARSETEMVELQASMRGAVARDAMIQQFRVVPVHARVNDVARALFLRRWVPGAFPVFFRQTVGPEVHVPLP